MVGKEEAVSRARGSPTAACAGRGGHGVHDKSIYFHTYSRRAPGISRNVMYAHIVALSPSSSSSGPVPPARLHGLLRSYRDRAREPRSRRPPALAPAAALDASATVVHA